MIHLFNKTYLDLDANIDFNVDRYVISEENGNKMLELLDEAAYGDLIGFFSTIDEVHWIDLIENIVNESSTRNTKVVVYCDKTAYKTFLTKWYKTILPNLNLESFTRIVDTVVYKERAIANTKLKSVNIVKINEVKEGLGDLTSLFNSTNIDPADVTKVDAMNIGYSFEFLLASHFAGVEEYKAPLKSVLKLFMRRWYNDAVVDARETALLNVLNPIQQKVFGYDESSVQLTSLNPLKNIEGFKAFSDTSMYDVNDNFTSGLQGSVKFEGLTSTQVTELKDVCKKMFTDFEGLDGKSYFDAFKFFDYVTTGEDLTDTQLDEVLDYIVANPVDTAFIPRGDTENVNYVFLHHVLNIKRNNNTNALSKFQLL